MWAVHVNRFCQPWGCRTASHLGGDALLGSNADAASNRCAPKSSLGKSLIVSVLAEIGTEVKAFHIDRQKSETLR